MEAPFFYLFKILMVHDKNSFDVANIRKKSEQTEFLPFY